MVQPTEPSIGRYHHALEWPPPPCPLCRPNTPPGQVRSGASLPLYHRRPPVPSAQLAPHPPPLRCPHSRPYLSHSARGMVTSLGIPDFHLTSARSRFKDPDLHPPLRLDAATTSMSTRVRLPFLLRPRGASAAFNHRLLVELPTTSFTDGVDAVEGFVAAATDRRSHTSLITSTPFLLLHHAITRATSSVANRHISFVSLAKFRSRSPPPFYVDPRCRCSSTFHAMPPPTRSTRKIASTPFTTKTSPDTVKPTPAIHTSVTCAELLRQLHAILRRCHPSAPSPRMRPSEPYTI